MRSTPPRSTRLVAPLAALAFVSLGLPDGLLGVAWPSMRAFFGVDLQALGGLLVATTTGYVASSFSSGRLLRRVNLGTVLAASCLLTACGLLGYAAASRWPIVLALGVLLGVGAGAIDAALNTYVATHHGVRTLNWLHACFGVGASSGPLLMTAVLRHGAPWQRGYVLVGAAQIALATCFAITFRAWPSSDGLSASADRTGAATMRATLTLPAAWLGMAVFIAYAGVEASIGAWTYTLLTVGRHVGIVEAGLLASLFWGGITGGRLLAALGGGAVSAHILLRVAVWSIVLGVGLVWANLSGALTAAGLVLAGFACGPIFPSLIAMTPRRVGGPHAANAVGFQIAASAFGLSVVPGLVGVAGARLGVEAIARLFLVLGIVLALVYQVLERAAPVETAEANRLPV
jgi:fucose permease